MPLDTPRLVFSASLVVSHDRMTGAQFEKGLADLKSLVEESVVESPPAIARA